MGSNKRHRSEPIHLLGAGRANDHNSHSRDARRGCCVVRLFRILTWLMKFLEISRTVGNDAGPILISLLILLLCSYSEKPHRTEPEKKIFSGHAEPEYSQKKRLFNASLIWLATERLPVMNLQLCILSSKSYHENARARIDCPLQACCMDLTTDRSGVWR